MSKNFEKVEKFAYKKKMLKKMLETIFTKKVLKKSKNCKQI